MKTLKVISSLSELNKIRAFLKINICDLCVSEEEYFIMELSLLEVCINIIRYAYPRESKGDIHLKTWQQDGKIYLEVRDSGIPFDPRNNKKPDLEEIIKEGKKGGFGIFLTKELMDGFEYLRENDQNILTLYKKLKN